MKVKEHRDKTGVRSRGKTLTLWGILDSITKKTHFKSKSKSWTCTVELSFTQKYITGWIFAAFRDDMFYARPLVTMDFHPPWCESHPWEQSLTAEPLCWLKSTGLHRQLVSAPPPSMLHLSGEIRARKHRLSDARNKFPCHINVCSSESESLVEQLPPLPSWQQRRVGFAINLSHLTADSAGYPPSTPLCCYVPGRDISCPCENKPEIWFKENGAK